MARHKGSPFRCKCNASAVRRRCSGLICCNSPNRRSKAPDHECSTDQFEQLSEFIFYTARPGRHSSAVEQLFRKQQVLGSNPSVGSTLHAQLSRPSKPPVPRLGWGVDSSKDSDEAPRACQPTLGMRPGHAARVRVTAPSGIDLPAFARLYELRAPRIGWLLGAGASAAAGVATASQATWDWTARIYATEKRIRASSRPRSDD